jgi:hypothetical protein
MEKTMAADERDRSFDKALARHLGSAAPAGEVAGFPAVPASQGGACPDSEILAAYHERSLLPEQLNSLKEHIVGCAHCQAILTQLEATDEISFEAFEQGEVVRKEAAAVMAARSLAPAPAAAAPSQSQHAAPPKRSPRVILLRGARWQWLAPAGAIAAGLLVWIALHENRTLGPPDLKHVQVATNQAPPAPAPAVSKQVQEVSPSAKAAVSKPQPPAGQTVAADALTALGAGTEKQRRDSLARVSPSRTLNEKESAVRTETGGERSSDSLSAAGQAGLDAKSMNGQELKKDESRTQAANIQTEIVQSQNAPAQNQNIYAPQKAPGPSALNQMEPSKKAKTAAAAMPAAPSPQPGEVGGAMASYSGSSSVEVAGAISHPRWISPSGSRVIWRVGRSGLIELSKDAGSSWSRQSSGVLVELLTGSAPSDQVCWIIGRVGAILLTIDGGAHWKLVPSPLAENLGGVLASDALHATVWNARRTKSFQTSDGGLTWTPVPSP